MLATNIDITDRLINGQIGVAKQFEFIGDKVDIIYIKSDNINAGKRFKGNSRVTIKRTNTYIHIGNSYILVSIQQTQFLLTLAWACTIHKVQGLIKPKSVISLELEKQKSFRAGQIQMS